MKNKIRRNWVWFRWLVAIGVVVTLVVVKPFGLFAVGQSQPKVVEVTKVVEVEKEVTKVVKETVVVKEVVTATPIPTGTPAPTQVPPTPTRTNAPTSTPTNKPTATPTGTSSIITSTVNVTSDACLNSGTLAWHADNLPGSAVYAPSIIGGLEESCWVVAQLWTTYGGTERWLIAVRPYSYIEIANHKGGSGWYFSGDEAAVRVNLGVQRRQVEDRDGVGIKTTILILPDQAALFRLITRFGSAPTPTATPIMTRTTTPTPTKTPTGVSTSATATVTPVTSGKCAGESTVGPAILETTIDGKPTVVKLNSGRSYKLTEGGCFQFESQAALDTRWPAHKNEFLAKYANGQAIEK